MQCYCLDWECYSLCYLLRQSNMKRIIKDGWHQYYSALSEMPDCLRHEIYQAHINNNLLPNLSDLYQAFTYFRPEQTRLVFIDSYPRSVFDRTSGLALAAPKEHLDYWQHDLQEALRQVDYTGDASLESLARQGCLFLNIRLSRTVDAPLAHAGLGWEEEAAKLLTRISNNIPHTVFIFCQPSLAGYKKYLNPHKCLILDLDMDSLYLAEDYLDRRGRGLIDWNLEIKPRSTHDNRP